MSTLSGVAARPHSKRWYRPGTWHLQTKLVFATTALLTVICFLVGIACYTAMSVTLNDQLDAQLNQASGRAANYNAAGPAGDPTGPQPDPLGGRGTGAGQLVVTIVGGHVTAAEWVALNGNRQSLPNADYGPLGGLIINAPPVDMNLSIGEYRLAATSTPSGMIVITGLPLAANNQTLATLVLTIVIVSLAGLAAVGLVGTVIIRRTMKPLEQLSSVATKVANLPLDAGDVALAVRVPANTAQPGTEVGNVGYALNNMLDNVSHALHARQRSETKVRRFVADASHELRTPLTAIRGYTELLQMTEELSEDGQTSLARVKAQSLRMGSLIEDLLMLARLDEGHTLQLQPLDVSQLVVETVSDIRVTATDHFWKLDVPDEPILAKCDEGQLKQVLLNLLSNAYKHTDAGTTVVAGVRPGADGTVVVTVTDDGPGIDPDFQEVIFDRFSRADQARSGTAGTTGLGLSIVQAIVEAHGGTIELTSKPGRTEFAVRLPSA
jgi:two-component system, OmpR family, sensor kinase